MCIRDSNSVRDSTGRRTSEPEKWLAEDVEAPASAALRRMLADSSQIGVEDKLCLAQYIVYLHSQAPAHRATVETAVGETADRMNADVPVGARTEIAKTSSLEATFALQEQSDLLVDMYRWKLARLQHKSLLLGDRPVVLENPTPGDIYGVGIFTASRTILAVDRRHLLILDRSEDQIAKEDRHQQLDPVKLNFRQIEAANKSALGSSNFVYHHLSLIHI